MKMNIDINNYEAFYLDYLEGNLNDAEIVMFKKFLAENPDLELEEEALTYLPDDFHPVLEEEFKAQFKIPDLAVPITSHNIDAFLIASMEGQLDADAQKALTAFLVLNPVYIADKAIFEKTILQPDLSIVYADKRKLKRAVILPFVFRVAAVAAILIFIVSIFNFNNKEEKGLAVKKNPGKSTKEHSTPEKITDGNFVIPDSQHNAGTMNINPSDGQVQGFLVNHRHKSEMPVNDYNLGEENVLAVQEHINTETGIQKNIKLDQLPAGNISNPLENDELAVNSTLKNKKEKIDPDLSGEGLQGVYTLVEMKNPVPAVTGKLTDFIRKEVDFKTTKAAKNRPGGFLIRIGKFEISRKKYLEQPAK